MAILWSAMALACIMLREKLGAVILIWLPAGVIVAALHVTPTKRWPGLALILLSVQVAQLCWFGNPILQSLGYAVASLAQSLVAAQLGKMVLGEKARLPSGFGHVVGLFAAAILGSLAGALIASIFVAGQTTAEFARWFLADVLGILTVTPILLSIRRNLIEQVRGQRFVFERSMISFLLACAIFTIIALQVTDIVIKPLLFAGIVLATVRYGRLASLLVILLCAGVGTLLSIFEGSPTPYLDASAAEAAVVLQSWLLAMLATVLPIAATLVKWEELQGELVHSNAQMKSSLVMFELAEDTVRMGRWWCNLITGEQDWSPNMLEMCGLPRSLAPDPGNVRDRLSDRGEELFGHIASNAASTEAYSFVYRIKPAQQLERILRVAMRNEFDSAGNRFAVFGVAIDVTEQVRREEALEKARGEAMRLAAEAQKLANTDPLTQLPNRRCTFDRLESMMVVADDRGRPLSMILFDIDYFKSVNDRYGHPVGDAVLKEVAQIAGKKARKGDIVGRIGGEEFVWLVAGTQDRTVHLLAERLRTCVEEWRTGSSLPKVTISVGLAHYRAGDTSQSLLARADAALYAAKDNGRNQVNLAA
ncbi:MAG: diguanylate cyclase [Alteraurantiacibacter sp.]